MSGGGLAHSRLCLEHINAKSIAISPVGIINLVYFIFSSGLYWFLAVLSPAIQQNSGGGPSRHAMTIPKTVLSSPRPMKWESIGHPVKISDFCVFGPP